MPVRSDDPLRRITLNLYEADCLAFIRTYGYGWTEKVRQVVHEHAKTLAPPRTLGDLFNEHNAEMDKRSPDRHD